ncbi:hypothetical protein BaRGS_00006237 [Batillaria attramentaria]|uniref:Uncharacterized protein n=1 Tax=Batillaria attramentaria TaxID=370345 RepID=A0ABD0LUP8_9CAEN
MRERKKNLTFQNFGPAFLPLINDKQNRQQDWSTLDEPGLTGLGERVKSALRAHEILRAARVSVYDQSTETGKSVLPVAVVDFGQGWSAGVGRLCL